jgi:hypothetical protein
MGGSGRELKSLVNFFLRSKSEVFDKNSVFQMFIKMNSRHLPFSWSSSCAKVECLTSLNSRAGLPDFFLGATYQNWISVPNT